MKLTLQPITLRDACAYVAKTHRHHRPPQGGKFAVAAACCDRVCGVAIVGRPVARHLDDGFTAEVTRCATDGTRNACSFLYRAAWRSARGMGYLRLITYTMPAEGGASLRASGFTLLGECGGGEWNRQGRPRRPAALPGQKLLWDIRAADALRAPLRDDRQAEGHRMGEGR
jgi:hypothetical protein